MNISLSRKYSLLLSSAFLLLTLGILLSWFNPVEGYDISIYTSTPIVYWIALASGILVSFWIVSARICGKKIPRYLMLAAYALLVFCMISLTYLLTIRGYYGYNFNGDTGSHIGNILAGLASGTLNEINEIYPNLYIHTMFLHNLSGLDVIYLTKVTPPIFILLFILGIYLLAREIFPKKEMAILSAFVACSLPFGVVSIYTGALPLPCYLPYTLALLFFSIFCLYVVYRIVNTQSSNKAFLVLGILLFISALFYHILACAVLLLFVVVLCGWIIFKRRLYQNVVPVITSLLTIVGTTVVSWLFWTALMQFLRIPVGSLYSALFEQDIGSVYSSELSHSLETAMRIDLVSLFDVLIWQFGSTGLIILLVVLSVPIVYFGFKKRQEFLNVVPFYIVMIPILAVFGFSLVSYTSFQPGRMVMFVTIGGILLSGIVLYTLFQYVMLGEKKLWHVVSVLLFIGIVAPLFVLGLQMYYPSYEVGAYFHSNTRAEVAGTEFYFETSNLDYPIISSYYVPHRFSKLLYGGQYVNNSGNMVQYGWYIPDLPRSHYDYDKYDTVLEWIKESSYLHVNEKTKIYHSCYLTHLSLKYTLNDYSHLSFDRGVNQVMDNGEMTWYLIHPTS